MAQKPEGYPVATLGGGCFWCIESEFRDLDGVLFTRVGYMGGHIDTPSYKDVTTGKSGHVEVVEVTFDPETLSYPALIEFFLTRAHDPTQVDRQGVDIGPQYASVIYYHDDDQKTQAEHIIEQIESRKLYKKPLATKLEPAQIFWEGEEYHQQYYEKYEAQNGRPHIRVFLKKFKK